MQNKTNLSETSFLISRKGILIIVLSVFLIALGYVLMGGEGSTDERFCPEIFSARRIVLAPLLCLTGYLLVIVGILLGGGKDK